MVSMGDKACSYNSITTNVLRHKKRAKNTFFVKVVFLDRKPPLYILGHSYLKII